MKNIPISGNSQGIRGSITVRLTEELSGSQGAGSIYRQAAFNRPALQPVRQSQDTLIRSLHVVYAFLKNPVFTVRTRELGYCHLHIIGYFAAVWKSVVLFI